MSVYPRSMPRQQIFPMQAFAALLLGLGIFVASILAWVIGYQLVYAGRIFPGVSVAGVDLSGLAPQEAAVKLSQTLTFPVTGRILFRDVDKVWVASPGELGMSFDASASAQSAYRTGRSGGPFGALTDQLRARQNGVNVAPVLVFDQRVAYAYINDLAAQVNQPMAEATLRLEGTNIVAQPGQVGRVVDVDATLALLDVQLTAFRDSEVPLFVHEQQPLILDVSAQADAARSILSRPLELVVPNMVEGDPGPWVFEPAILANMLTVQRIDNNGQSEIRVGLEPGALAQVLTPIAAQVDRKAKDARFHFDDQGANPTMQLELLASATIGRTTDVPASVAAINDALLKGEHIVSLVVNEVQPAIPDTATAESLGIREKIVEQTTYYYGSDPARVQNIKAAAKQFDGIFVAPGATFSMGEILSDITLDNGFAEAWIIYNGRTIKGVGGGVCQVSTTLFRAALYAGFPILERIPHAYRVSYYEKTSSGARDNNLAGMDATVYFPLVDFKFVNDSDYWLLMETYPGDTSLTWKFYSISDGRKVKVDTTGPINIVPAPEPLFQVNPDFKAGQIKQVDWAADGSDVTVTRTVLKDGVIYFTDTFKTHYEPWQAVCQYGPGTEDVEKLAQKHNLCQPPAT